MPTAVAVAPLPAWLEHHPANLILRVVETEQQLEEITTQTSSSSFIDFAESVFGTRDLREVLLNTGPWPCFWVSLFPSLVILIQFFSSFIFLYSSHRPLLLQAWPLIRRMSQSHGSQGQESAIAPVERTLSRQADSTTFVHLPRYD